MEVGPRISWRPVHDDDHRHCKRGCDPPLFGAAGTCKINGASRIAGRRWSKPYPPIAITTLAAILTLLPYGIRNRPGIRDAATAGDRNHFGACDSAAVGLVRDAGPV